MAGAGVVAVKEPRAAALALAVAAVLAFWVPLLLAVDGRSWALWLTSFTHVPAWIALALAWPADRVVVLGQWRSIALLLALAAIAGHAWFSLLVSLNSGLPLAAILALLVPAIVLAARWHLASPQAETPMNP
ncbi:MAG: hypothetical protein QOD77_772 [Thermoplasmata archaeon]|nr:hypothetical protein [Thermoplasmata archaeon]